MALAGTLRGDITPCVARPASLGEALLRSTRAWRRQLLLLISFSRSFTSSRFSAPTPAYSECKCVAPCCFGRQTPRMYPRAGVEARVQAQRTATITDPTPLASATPAAPKPVTALAAQSGATRAAATTTPCTEGDHVSGTRATAAATAAVATRTSRVAALRTAGRVESPCAHVFGRDSSDGLESVDRGRHERPDVAFGNA